MKIMKMGWPGWIVVALTVAGVANADEPVCKPPQGPPEAAPTPAKELDGLKPFQKGWSCAGADMAGTKYTAKLTLKKDLDGFWTAVRYERPKTKTAAPFTGVAYIGLDPVAHNWWMGGVDSMGGAINLHSAGPAGESVTWEGDAVNMGSKMPAKFSMTIDPNTKHMHFAVNIGGKTVIDEDCK